MDLSRTLVTNIKEGLVDPVILNMIAGMTWCRRDMVPQCILKPPQNIGS